MDTKKIGAEVFGELRNAVLEENGEDIMVREVTNEILERIGEKWTLLNSIIRRKASWIGHILTRNCLLHDVIEGQIKGIGRRRRIQLLDDSRDKRICLELKQELQTEKGGSSSLSHEHRKK